MFFHLPAHPTHYDYFAPENLRYRLLVRTIANGLRGIWIRAIETYLLW